MGACYVIRFVLHMSNGDTLIPVYFACFHSIMKCEIFLWHISSNSKKIFILQKKFGSIMEGIKLDVHVDICLRDHTT
jgi:hypothetical protein